MRTATVAVALLSTIIPAAIAVPQLNKLDDQNESKANISKVAYGQQLQEEDQTNHWVVWLEGKSACPPAVVLDLLTDSPCGMTFELPGSSRALEFRDCGGDGEPNALFADGTFVRTCKHHTSTVHCGEKSHNVIKHGKCIG